MEKRKISCLIILLLVSSSLWAQQYWLVASKGIVKYKHNDKNVKLDYAVVDRLSIVTHIKEIKGSKEDPIYIKRGDRI